MDHKTYHTVDGHPVRVASRRRYGTTTYTWLEIEVKPNVWAQLEDPWPCIMPGKADVEKVARRVLASIKP